jgi:hypothetical protein
MNACSFRWRQAFHFFLEKRSRRPISGLTGEYREAFTGFLKNAENCAQLAERAADEPTRNRYMRMEAAWRALAEEQDWLDGQVPPVRIAC